MPGLGEVLVPASTAPGLARPKDADPAWPSPQFVRRSLIGDGRCRPDEQCHVRAGVARTVRTFTVPASVRLELTVVAVTQQRVVMRVGLKIDATACPPSPPDGPRAARIFSRRKRDAAVASVSSFYVDLGFVDKHLNSLP